MRMPYKNTGNSEINEQTYSRWLHRPGMFGLHLLYNLLLIFLLLSCSNSMVVDRTDFESFSEGIFKVCKNGKLEKLYDLYISEEMLEKCSSPIKNEKQRSRLKNSGLSEKDMIYLKDIEDSGYVTVSTITEEKNGVTRYGEEEKAHLKSMLKLSKDNIETLVQVKNGCKANMYFSKPKMDCQYIGKLRGKYPNCQINGSAKNIKVPVEYADAKKGYMKINAVWVNNQWTLTNDPPYFYKYTQ